MRVNNDENNIADLAAFGIQYILNPDPVERFRDEVSFAEAYQKTFYKGGAKGFTDYPFIK